MVPYETEGSTRYVDFFTRRNTYVTNPAKCHLSHVVADTDSWEQKLAQTLEDMAEILAYVKNQNLGFYIPYSNDAQERKYPDFLARMKPPKSQPFTLILECSGPRLDKGIIKVVATKHTVLYPDHCEAPVELLNFIYMRGFEKEWKELGFDDDDLQALEIIIMARPHGPPVRKASRSPACSMLAIPPWIRNWSGKARTSKTANH